ncbi:MAG TPA: DNA gyrase inhibitor YacG [Terriglobia bacterium]|nr:DNA gyrase inhibitor YacG [Terriglobia bacterium]
MRCPICKNELAGGNNPYRPFCSERCKLIDLDHWLSGRYRISTPLSAEERHASLGQVGVTSATGSVPDTETDAKADLD